MWRITRNGILRKTKMIKLVRPTEALKEQALEFKQEFFDNGEFVINGSELLDKMDDYREWCRIIDANTKEETVNPDWVITDTFFAVAGNDRIVGIIDLRHTLNDFLKDLGNCGYSVRPSERRKGYAAAIIRCCETGRDERTAGRMGAGNGIFSMGR